ncbi:MAG: hypothetical protein IJB31_00410 [Akkermansia sp.]|nr:hypothetical protein [Akkermansia sp.]
MKSLILTTLYLAKDTIHRWFSRVSSPLARVLVVYFLGLCALCSLGSYALATKIVRDKIISRGGDLVMVSMTGGRTSGPIAFPTAAQVEELLGAESYAVKVAGSAQTASGQHVPVYTFDFSHIGQFMPLMARSGGPTLLQTPDGKLPPGPADVDYYGERRTVFVRHLPENHLLMRLMNGKGILMLADDLPESMRQSAYHQLIARVRHLENTDSILNVERYFRRYMRLENANGHVISASRLLEELENVLSKQTLCRMAFCLGISCIVGILLTALAGMEYRQNEYIYTLMKSFGIHPFMLVGAFIAENLLIVGGSFVAAIATFMYFQKIIVTQLLKLGHYSLSLQEIMPEIHLISVTLVVCVLVSSIPIIIAAHRDIGRVLK